MNTLHWLAHALAVALWLGGEVREVERCAEGKARACERAVEDGARGP